MNTNIQLTRPNPRRRIVLGLCIGVPAILFAWPLICAPFQRPQGGGVDRSSHGSIRHEETHIVQRPVEVHHEPEHPVGHAEVPFHGVAPRHDVFVHHDVDVDLHQRHFWNDFAFHRHHGVLPFGFLSLQIGGVPYFYDDGIYYQPADGGYEEVYPPVGAAIPQPPDGSVEIYAGGQNYYYAGGAFYLQQPDGT